MLSVVGKYQKDQVFGEIEVAQLTPKEIKKLEDDQKLLKMVLPWDILRI